MNRLSLLLFTLFLSASCSQDSTSGTGSSTVISSQPKVLDDGAGFDLEKATFNEDVPTLYSKRFINDYAFDSDSAYDPTHPQADSIFRYRIESYMAGEAGLSLPKKDFGFLYKTPQLDSVAKIGGAFFHTLYTLTDLHKKPVAYYAEAEISDPKMVRQFLSNFRKKYGEPAHAYYLDRGFDVQSYEWVIADRTIQIETSFGWRASVSSDGSSSSGKYYRLDLLLLSNKAKAAIDEAHVFTLPDPFVKDGKSYSLKSLQLEPVNRAKDEFSLNSAQPYLADVDEYSMYHISNAPAETPDEDASTEEATDIAD